MRYSLQTRNCLSSLFDKIFQTSILIHDDIIDNDNLRRGKNTIHYSNYLKYKSLNDTEAKKTSESIGICIGDYGFFKVNEILIRHYKDDPNFSKLFDYYIEKHGIMISN